MPLLIIVGVVAVLVTLMILAERRRKKKLTEFFASIGATFAFTKDQGAKDAAFAPLVGIEDLLRTGSKGVSWGASLTRGGLPIHVVEHTYTTGSGKSRSTHNHIVIAVRTPRAWSRMTLTREHIFTRIGKAFGLKDLDLESPEFNKRWRVSTDDENFALAAISPAVQSLLGDERLAELAETWRFGGGVFTATVGQTLGADRMSSLLDRFTKFVEAMEPEMREQLLAAAASTEPPVPYSDDEGDDEPEEDEDQAEA